MQGKAVVFTAPRKVDWQPLELPDPGPGDVVIRVQHSWISNGTEGSFLRCERVNGETPWTEGAPWPFPLVPGYQKTGRVEWVGKDVQGIRKGDLVFATVSRVGDSFYESFGGHVSPAVTASHQVWLLPEGLPEQAACGLVLLQVGYNCGTRTPIEKGDVVLVIGDGLVGHWSGQTLADRGATVILTGKHEDRLVLFGPCPPHHTVDITKVDPLEKVRAWAPAGLSAVVDTVGSVQDLERFMPVMKRGGHLVSAGFHGSEGKMDLQHLRFRELSLHSPSGWDKDRMDATLTLLAEGRLQTEHLITHRFPASNASEAYDLILKRKEPVLGVILDWET